MTYKTYPWHHKVDLTVSDDANVTYISIMVHSDCLSIPWLTKVHHDIHKNSPWYKNLCHEFVRPWYISPVRQENHKSYISRNTVNHDFNKHSCKSCARVKFLLVQKWHGFGTIRYQLRRTLIARKSFNSWTLLQNIEKLSGAHMIKNRLQVAGGIFDHGESESGVWFGSELMQLFANSKSMILIKIRILCPALYQNGHSPQKLPDRQSFLRRFLICVRKHDSSPQSRDKR